MTDDTKSAYNKFAQGEGAKKIFWEEELKLRYQNKSKREYFASVYNLPYQEFPITAFTSEPVYLQWCILVSGMMPSSRGRDFRLYMRERLADAEEQEIPPNMEEGVEVGNIVLSVLKSCLRFTRNFDEPQEDDKLRPGEWLFTEASIESTCGREIYIKYEGLKGRIINLAALGQLEMVPKRREVVSWLVAHGRYYNKSASVNRWRCAYVLPFHLVESFEFFPQRTIYSAEL